jgi:hypothetical protein
MRSMISDRISRLRSLDTSGDQLRDQGDSGWELPDVLGLAAAARAESIRALSSASVT